MTFDNEDELLKIKEIFPSAKYLLSYIKVFLPSEIYFLSLVLRIKSDNQTAPIRLSMKFGAEMNISYKLIETAFSLNLNLIGIR